MHARLTLTAKHEKTGHAETINVTVECPNTHGDLFQIVTRLAQALNAFSACGWQAAHVGTKVTGCPAGFFAKQQLPSPEAK